MAQSLSEAVSRLMNEEAIGCHQFVKCNRNFVSSNNLEALQVPWHTLIVEAYPKFCDEKKSWFKNPRHKLIKLVTEELKLEILGHLIVGGSSAVKFFFPDGESLINAKNILSLGKMDEYLLTTRESLVESFFRLLKEKKVERDAASYYSLSNIVQSMFSPLSRMPLEEQLSWKESTGVRFLDCFITEFCSVLNGVKDTNEKLGGLNNFWKESKLGWQDAKNRFFYNIYRCCELESMRSVGEASPADFILKWITNVETLQKEPGLLVNSGSDCANEYLAVPLKYVPFAGERILEIAHRLEPYISRAYDSDSKVAYCVNIHGDYSGRNYVDILEYCWNKNRPNFEVTKAHLLHLLVDENNSLNLNWVQLTSFLAGCERECESFEKLSITDKIYTDLIWSRDMSDMIVDNVLTDSIVELGNVNENSTLVLIKCMHSAKGSSQHLARSYLTYECILSLSRRCKQIAMSRKLYDYHANLLPGNLIPLQSLDIEISGRILSRTLDFTKEELTIFYDFKDINISFEKFKNCSAVKRVIYLVSNKRSLEIFKAEEKISQTSLFVPTKIIPINLSHNSVDMNYLVLFERRCFTYIINVDDTLLGDCEWLKSFQEHEDVMRSGAYLRPEEDRFLSDSGGNYANANDFTMGSDYFSTNLKKREFPSDRRNDKNLKMKRKRFKRFNKG